MNEYGSYSKEVSELLDVNPNTLRRWSIDLEKKGYVFERNEKGQRIYYKRDILALRHLQKLVGERVPMDNALTKVANDYINKIELERTLSVYEDSEEKAPVNNVQITLTKDELQTLIETSVKTAINEEREMMFKAFEAKLNDVIEVRDRHLVNQLNQSLEQKQLEIAATKEQEKKGFFSRLFRK